jgi:hypothetical protein
MSRASPCLCSTTTQAAICAHANIFSQDDVVRITTNLVQMDVVVTNKHGDQEADLQPEDSEIRVEGRPQPITNFFWAGLEKAFAKTTNRTPHFRDAVSGLAL